MTPSRLRGPITMPFGKFAGQPVDTLPTRYVCWLATIPPIGSRAPAEAIDTVHTDRCGRVHRRREFGEED
jgi:hypothetical protein